MTIQQKADAYDRALEVLHKYDGMPIMFSQDLKEEMFPELVKKRDEEIRKALIDGFTVMKESKNCGKTFSNHNILVTDILNWLKKQGELIEGEFIDVSEVRDEFMSEVYRILDTDPTNDRANQIIDVFDNLPTVELKKQGNQKPVKTYAELSKEDKEMIRAIRTFIVCGHTGNMSISTGKMTIWLKSLENKINSLWRC